MDKHGGQGEEEGCGGLFNLNPLAAAAMKLAYNYYDQFGQ